MSKSTEATVVVAKGLKATKAAAKAPGKANVLKLDAATGELKAVPAKARKEALQAVAEAVSKPAPKSREQVRAERYPEAAKKTVTAKPGQALDTNEYPSKADAVKAALANGRESTGVFHVAGKFRLGSRRAGIAKGWEYLGRAKSLRAEQAS